MYPPAREVTRPKEKGMDKRHDTDANGYSLMAGAGAGAR